jgi:hypothetical protein
MAANVYACAAFLDEWMPPFRCFVTSTPLVAIFQDEGGSWGYCFYNPPTCATYDHEDVVTVGDGHAYLYFGVRPEPACVQGVTGFAGPRAALEAARAAWGTTHK